MRIKLWQQLALATLIATGIALVWGFLAAWGISTYESRMRQTNNLSYESLAVDAQGNAWIRVNQQYAYSTYLAAGNQTPFRTLDGQPIQEPSHDFWLTECSLPHPGAIQWYDGNLENSWSRRVTQIATVPEHWYLVHNGSKDDGRAYLVGYDLVTKLPIGYCSKLGYRSELPSEDQWFRLDGRTLGYRSGGFAVASSHKSPRIALATRDGWYEFDVRQRVFRTIDDSQPYDSVGTCTIPEEIPEDAREELSKNQPPAFSLTAGLPEVFAARQQDRIVVQNHQQEQPYEFIIPDEYRDRHIDLYFVSPDQVILETSQGQRAYYESLLVWTNAAGEIQKTEEIVWHRATTSNTEGTVVATLAVPIPLAVGTVLAGIVPFNPHMAVYAEWETAGYLKRLGLLLSDAWLPLLGLTLVSAALAWLALRWHRHYSRPDTAAWASWVFLLGVPGILTYWAVHRRTALEACTECGHQIPRNRDTCAHCEQPFPEPQLLGTEVFA